MRRSRRIGDNPVLPIFSSKRKHKEEVRRRTSPRASVRSQANQTRDSEASNAGDLGAERVNLSLKRLDIADVSI